MRERGGERGRERDRVSERERERETTFHDKIIQVPLTTT